MRPQLVLDIGNVVLADAMPDVFSDIAHSRLEQEMLEQRHAELSAELWTGRVGEDEYWAALATAIGLRGPDPRWREMLVDRLRPLMSRSLLGRWAGMTEVVALSNHRSDWVLPALERA